MKLWPEPDVRLELEGESYTVIVEGSELHLPVMPTGGRGCWSKPLKALPRSALSSSQTASPEVHLGLLKGTVQPQQVLLSAESRSIQLQSSIMEEINVGGNKGHTQRSKTGVGSRSYMLTVSHLAP